MTDGSVGDQANGSRDEALRRRVIEQFSDTDERAAIWRGFEKFLPTGAYLNLGYSPRYLPTLVGDSQARLADRLADGLSARLEDSAGARLLDLGCGRGGPARRFTERGFDVTGLDLVPYNVTLARANARPRGPDARAGSGRPPLPPQFLVGDATALPFDDGVFDACAAVDSLVYLSDEGAAFAEIGRVLDDGGWVAVADLLAAEDAPPGVADRLDDFAAAWDTAPIAPSGEYFDSMRRAGFTVETVEDVTPNSVGRFRKWSKLFLALADGPASKPLRTLLRRWGVEPEAAVAQVRSAHRALPHLEHVIVYARSKPEAGEASERDRPAGEPAVTR